MRLSGTCISTQHRGLQRLECLTVVAQLVFIEHRALPLIGDVGNPNASYAKAQPI